MNWTEFDRKEFHRRKSVSIPSRAALIDEMTREVEKHVKRWKTDWTDYDLPLIQNRIPDFTVYIWILRENGTHMMSADCYDSIRSVLDCFGPENVRAYAFSVGPKGASLVWLRNPEEILDDAKKNSLLLERTVTA